MQELNRCYITLVLMFLLGLLFLLAETASVHPGTPLAMGPSAETLRWVQMTEFRPMQMAEVRYTPSWKGPQKPSRLCLLLFPFLSQQTRWLLVEAGRTIKGKEHE